MLPSLLLKMADRGSGRGLSSVTLPFGEKMAGSRKNAVWNDFEKPYRTAKPTQNCLCLGNLPRLPYLHLRS